MFFALFASLASCLISIPARPLGIKYGTPGAPIFIEIYVDMICPDCATEFNLVMELLKLYPTQIEVVYHFFELPSHTWAYLLTRTVFAANKLGEEYGKMMLQGLLGNMDQQQFWPTTLADTPESQVTKLALQYASKQTGIDYDTLELNYDDLSVILLTRTEFKYSLVHNLQGTPTVYFNGAKTTLTELNTIQDWVDMIDGLLQK